MTFADLQAAIDAAVAANGGPFRRIVVISHAGGPANGPSADLGTERLTAANLKANPQLVASINKRLSPTGIFVMATCGYCYEILSGPDHSIVTAQTAAYQAQWEANLAAIAAAIGHPAYADPGTSQTNTHLGSLTRLKAPPRKMLMRMGFAPDGSKLP